VRFYTKNGRFAFFSPPLVDLEAMYDDHVRFIGKCVMDFLLVLTELFMLLRLRHYERISVQNWHFSSNG